VFLIYYDGSEIANRRKHRRPSTDYHATLTGYDGPPRINSFRI
jgi:hypothetical protein